MEIMKSAAAVILDSRDARVTIEPGTDGKKIVKRIQDSSDYMHN